MNIRDFWTAILRQDANEIRQYFKPDAYINWHCTNEHFTVEEFIRANCEYPGQWDGMVERVEQTDDLIITATKVFSKDDGSSFHVVSFLRIEDDKIAAMDEYWGDDGPAPQWRQDKHIGMPINSLESGERRGKRMKIMEMNIEDIDRMIPLYLDYYNNHEDGCWTEMTARKRINQVLKMDDSYSLIMFDDKQNVVGFVMGYFKQYDDIVGYTLEEIAIAYEYQNKGLGSRLLQELEERVKEKGASCIELQAVKDDMHEQYYGKAGYSDAKNFVMKVKWLV